MKLLTLFLVSYSLTFGAFPFSFWKTVAGGPAYLVSEGAEGTGTPSGWTDANSPNWDYTTTVLEGSQSLEMANGSASVSYTIAANSTVWAYCLFRTATLNDQYVLRMRDATTDQKAAVRFLADGRVRVYSGSGDIADSAAGFVAANTTYSVWLQYTKGTGANSIARCFVAATTTKPATTAEVTNGGEQQDVTEILILPFTADVAIWDHIRVSASTIGSAP